MFSPAATSDPQAHWAHLAEVGLSKRGALAFILLGLSLPGSSAGLLD
jgi:hypothetical protein